METRNDPIYHSGGDGGTECGERPGRGPSLRGDAAPGDVWSRLGMLLAVMDGRVCWLEAGRCRAPLHL